MAELTSNPAIVLIVGAGIEADIKDDIDKRVAALGKEPLSACKLSDWLAAPQPDVKLVCLLSDAEIRLLLSHPQVAEWPLAFLPLPSNRQAQISFGVPAALGTALNGAIEIDQTTRVDLLVCNGEIILDTIIVGDVWGLQARRSDDQFWSRIADTLRHLGSLRLQSFVITTGKGQQLELAAMGVMIFGYNLAGESTTAIHQELLPNDGKLNAFVVAPTSVLGHLWFLFKMKLMRRLSLQDLPDSVGFIRTSALTIARAGTNVASHGGEVSEWNIEVRRHAAQVLINKKLQRSEAVISADDAVRTTHLPTLATSRMFRDKSLPLFPHAAEADFRELFQTLRSNAEISISFVVLMILSTLLAGTGLFLNSASVIIGAMILAPLMGPIISLAMGVVRSESVLIASSLKTLSCGLAVALSFAAVFALIMPLQVVTSEMDSRLHPSLLDLLVALLSGVAGGYANAKSEVAKSLAGVAIAVALVPPLAVAGIGLGWMHLPMVMGAGLLFITNLVGIMLAASLTFLILGFAPVKRARRALLLSLGIVLVVAIPLAMAFRGMTEQSDIRRTVSALLNSSPLGHNAMVKDVVFENDMPVIRLQVKVTGTWDIRQADAYKRQFEASLQRPVVVECTVVYKQ